MAEVILGIPDADKRSYLNAKSTFTPSAPIARTPGHAQVRRPGRRTMIVRVYEKGSGMSIQYRYFGLLRPGDTPDDPSGVVRTWTDENGFPMEETYSFRLTWTRSDIFSPLSRSDYRIVEIDESVVGPFIEQVKKLHGQPDS